MIKLFIISLIIAQSSLANTLFNTATKAELSIEELALTLDDNAIVVLGEYHSMPTIQLAEAEIIRKIVQTKKLESNFTVGWEFLNYTDQSNISNTFSNYKTGTIDEIALLDSLFPNAEDTSYYTPYVDFLKVSKELDGQVIGLNAPRSMKQVITKKGIKYMDPELVPSNMERGSDNYFNRFLEAMGGHVSKAMSDSYSIVEPYIDSDMRWYLTEYARSNKDLREEGAINYFDRLLKTKNNDEPSEMIERFFMAQSYTDSVMAWYLNEDAFYDFRFVIVGSFHTDYNDGLVSQITKDTSSQTVTIKIVNPSMLGETELEAMKNGHGKYGQIADYIYILK